jgi:hypothetical protein
MSFIKLNWKPLLVIIAIIGYQVGLGIGLAKMSSSIAATATQVKTTQATVAKLNALGDETINMAQGGSMASSTDFVNAVYMADVQIQQALQNQAAQQTPTK